MACTAGLVFVGAGLATNGAIFAALSAGQVVWADILHNNPHRSHENTLTMLVLSPLYGAAGVLFLTLLSTLAAGVLAAITGALRRCVPFWATVAMAVPCGAVSYVQARWWGFEEFPVALPDLPRLVAPLAVAQLPALLCCWVLLRRFVRRQSAAAPASTSLEANSA